MNKTFATIISLILIVSMTGCDAKKSDFYNPPLSSYIDGDTTTLEDFQKNMHQSKYFYITDMCETDAGVYFNYNGYLYYLNKKDKRATILCAKPDCQHKGKDCNAWINSWGMWRCEDKLYCITFANGGNGGKFVTSMANDGTERRDVQELSFNPGGSRSSYDRPVFYGGDVYYVYNDVLYRVPLGGDKEDAKALWGEDAGNGGGGPLMITGNELHLTLWADGEYIYVMANIEQCGGTYKDTLFAYSIKDKQIRQVWAVPDEAEAGKWDTTGVSVSAWYVLDGTIYFYLAGNGFWRSSLNSGETVLLAGTGDTAEYGTALFSDDYMCLLNDLPGEHNENEGGDTFYIYGLDGTLQKELPLTALFNAVDGITGFSPLFLSENEIYFVVDAGSWGDIKNGVQYEDKTDILCSVNVDTGEVTQIYNL